jgi:hypothetical protein
LTKAVNIADRSYFKLAVERKTFAIGDYQIGRVTDKASLNLGYPIRENDHSITGVVFAALDLLVQSDRQCRQFAWLLSGCL